jgi:hypothetical protein
VNAPTVSPLRAATASVRRFLGIPEAEAIELTAFVQGRIMVAHARTPVEHERLLAEADRIPGFNGAYMLVNGPMDPALLARYDVGRWHRAWNGRATDRDIATRRAVFLDVDPVRPKGISATDEHKAAAGAVAAALRDFFAAELGDADPIGAGDSGNGFFTLLALEPAEATTDQGVRISKLIAQLNKKFSTPLVKIDASVFNAARLMPCPGTWKRKGTNTPERPHRMTSFTCSENVRRVPLEVFC